MTAPVASLLPCPFCGAEDVALWHANNQWRAGCAACGASPGPDRNNRTKDAAIAAWNRRALASPAGEGGDLDAAAVEAGHITWRSMQQCADTWLAINTLLHELVPGWTNNSLTGREAALAAIRRLATTAGVQVDDWQQRCLDLGFKYWRAPDAHGVECTHEQARALLRDLLGVEVDFTTPPPAPAADRAFRPGWKFSPGSVHAVPDFDATPPVPAAVTWHRFEDRMPPSREWVMAKSRLTGKVAPLNVLTDWDAALIERYEGWHEIVAPAAEQDDPEQQEWVISGRHDDEDSQPEARGVEGVPLAFRRHYPDGGNSGWYDAEVEADLLRALQDNGQRIEFAYAATPNPVRAEQPEGKGALKLPPDTGPFADWLAREMPSGTVIGDPGWWATKILRQIAFLAAAPAAPGAAVGVDGILGKLPAPIQNPEAWPPNYAAGYNDCARIALDEMTAALAATSTPVRAEQPEGQGMVPVPAALLRRIAAKPDAAACEAMVPDRCEAICELHDFLATAAPAAPGAVGVDELHSVAEEMRFRYARSSNVPDADAIHQHAVDVAAALTRWADRIDALAGKAGA